MRRIRISLTVALLCLFGAIVVPEAVAGNFDEQAMGCAGEDPATCASATVGQPYSMTIYLTRDSPNDPPRGGDFDCATFHVSSGNFPPGLSISDEAIVTGTPTAAGSYTFYLTVRYDKEPTCGKTPSDDRFTINVNPGGLPPPPPPPTPAPPPRPTVTVMTDSLPDANINQPYTSPGLTATGATVTSWTLAGGTLPAGLDLATNGVITGTATQSGTFAFTVQANANGASATKDLSLFVLAPLALHTYAGRTPPARGLTAKRVLNVPLVTGVAAIGGRAPYTFTAQGELPPGITLDPTTGRISGSGTTAGLYRFTETVTDSTGTKLSVPWKVTIVPLLSFVEGKLLPVGRVNKRYTARLPVTGRDAATAEFTITGSIPPGLEIDATGRLTGRLLRAGTYRIHVFAFSESGASVNKRFLIRVRK